MAVAAQTLLEVKGEDPGSITCAVQGVGAMGAGVIRYFSETGAMMIHVSPGAAEATSAVPMSARIALCDSDEV